MPLTPDERQNVMRAAIAYSLADDEASLDRLRTHFGPKMKTSADASAFAVVTQNIDLQGVAFRDMAGKIASVDTLEGFMQDFKKRFETAKVNSSRPYIASAPCHSPARRASHSHKSGLSARNAR